ncbi:MAG TPA: bifunctional diguanylate cyclase/phosphodiesterase [Acidimicrobiales bacterium]|nr:bifunctional diguanylate cyclase/phosphodiesterase [Acidimicrobiales bacterium]
MSKVKHWTRARGTSLDRSRARRVWLLNALLTAIGFAVCLATARDAVGPLRGSFAISPWLLAALFGFAEAFLVHVVFRREAYSVSLSEVPLVLGLFFATGPELVLAHLLGAGTSLVVYRRQPPFKLFFNLAHMAVGTGTALGVFHLLDPGSGAVSLRAGVVATMATAAAVCVSAPAVVAAISLYERRPPAAKLALGVLAHFAASVGNTSLGLMAVTLMWVRPAAGWLMVVPAAVVLAAYRTILVSRRKQESLQFLYEASGILHRGASREGPMVELLDLARSMFNADYAELTLFPADDGERGLRTTVGPGDAVSRLQPVDVDRDVDADAEGRGLPMPAMVAHLQGEHRRVGTMLLAGPSAVRRSFSRRDFQLFETLANQVGVALENGVLETSLAQLTALKEELRHQAFHDDLTGLGNRALFVAEVARVAEHPRPGEAMAVLFVDLDDFKTVNDTLGHGAGDELLVRTAERLRRCLRPQDVAARLGGDEFAVLLAGFGVDADAVHVAERVLAALLEPVEVAGDLLRLSASIGVAVGAAGACSVDELLRNADVAMYTAKVRGKGRWERFEPHMQRAVAVRHAVKTQLQSAVERDEFVLRYQPIVDLPSGRIVGVEALVRWRHPTRGLLGPAEFIDVAEEIGLVGRLGRRVLRTACAQARQWQEERDGRSAFFVSVNVSPRELQHADFVADVGAVLRETGLDPSSLLLEITENAMVDGATRAGRVVGDLRALGVRVAVDDFGTGYSSLRYLDEFDVDVLKMAKPFVDGLASERNRPALAQAIVQLGASLELELVAEGVESFDQVEALRAMGCRLAQGFLLGRPVDAGELARLLARGHVPVHDARRRHLGPAALRRRAAGLPA